MKQPGKLIFKLYEDTDKLALAEFCSACSLLGYENNASFEAMKLDKAYFFIALDGNKIVSVAGVHKLPEVNEHAWRCLFRGAQLPGYAPAWSMDIFKSGIHFSQFLYRQIKLAQDIDPQAEFYVSTNVKADTGAKSSRMNDIMMPRIAKRGIWNLHLENFELYHVPQNLWKINVDIYLELRAQYLE
jgi:hypothetical protein